MQTTSKLNQNNIGRITLSRLDVSCHIEKTLFTILHKCWIPKKKDNENINQRNKQIAYMYVCLQ